MEKIIQQIETAFSSTNEIGDNEKREIQDAVDKCLGGLDNGSIRIAEPTPSGWVVNEWAKKAVLLSFKLKNNYVFEEKNTKYYDKVELKFKDFEERDFISLGSRIVPQATVRKGAYIGRNVVLMPSYVNIGAYVDDGTMIDTWATVGSCAQIGRNVHLSGGAGIGGVLEPLQATPTIIEDNCFIGARAEIVEGVVIRKGAVIAMGVFIGQSTKIFDRETGQITRGEVPEGSVVVPGSLPAEDGSHSVACAIIIKKVDAATRKKVSLNDLLRD